MLLRITQSFRINYIELNMVTVEAEITPYQSCQIPVTVFILKKLRRKFLVQKGTSGPQMIYL